MKMFTASSIYKQEFYVLCKHYDSRAQADHQVPVRCTLKRKPFLSSILESNTCFSWQNRIYLCCRKFICVLLEDVPVHKNKMMKYVQITGVNGSTLTVKEHTYMLLVSNDTVLLHVSCFSADRQLCRYKTSTAAVSKNGIEKHCLVNNIKILEKKEI